VHTRVKSLQLALFLFGATYKAPEVSWSKGKTTDTGNRNRQHKKLNAWNKTKKQKWYWSAPASAVDGT
jgi:hypothetical protein